MPHAFPAHRPFALTALAAASFACVALLTACGGDGSTATAGAPSGAASAPTGAASAPATSASAPTSTASTSLSGTVAVGAAMVAARLRVLDADGNVVASNVAADADGRYAGIELTGPAPYRIEACGQAGANYQCLYSVASAAGTANVTPLTTAVVLLAAGQPPEALMTGAAPTLNADTVAAAQTQLRASLASVLSSAGVSESIDFISGSLNAGSRSGYDGLLDSIGVTIGHDDTAFVQITPRLGDGNLYLEQGLSVGTVTSVANPETLQLSGLETLFSHLSESLASAAACSGSATGITRSIAANAKLSMGDGEPAQGVTQVADTLCSFFASGDDGSTPMWGSKLLSPTLGHCDTSGAAPVCAVSFVLQSPEGDVMPMSNALAVTQESGAWKLQGDLLPIDIRASARAQRTERIDTAAPIYEYNRALAFEVAAVEGLACAKVSQRDADGAQTTIAYYKRHPGAAEQGRLSLWTPDGFGWGASLDPNVGMTRGADDTWLGLPEGAQGDAVVRNFYRGGRGVNFALYGDAACSVPFTVAGKSDFDVEMEGVPPVWSSMEALPWPELDATSQAALRSLSIAAGATASFQAGWSFVHGPLGIGDVTFCGSRGDCGDGGAGRLGSRSLRPSALGVTLALQNRGSAVGADDPKTFGVSGRTGDGLGMESNFSSCATADATQPCH